MTLWSTDDEGSLDQSVTSFTQSLDLDTRLLKYDIQASIVWAEALSHSGALTHSEFEELKQALGSIKEEIEQGDLELDPNLEDIHMNVESELIERLGDTGAKIHYGRSRNDQVLVDVKLYLKDQIVKFQQQLTELLSNFLKRAEEHKDTFLPGYTHLQAAQPIRLSHYLLAFFQKFRRDFERLEDAYNRVDVLPLGSAALAGAGVNVDREFIAKELGFSQISHNSFDAVSARDFMVEVVAGLTQISVHASRLCEDWIVWSSPGYEFCQLSDEFTTGSSIMPQKNNPDVAELVRGHSGRLNGSLTGLITLLKAQPTAYNRDLQDDKYHLFSAIDSASKWLPLLTEMVRSVSFNSDAMSAALDTGFLEATDLADHLVEKGIPFREAHELVRKAVMKAKDEGTNLREMDLEQYHEVDARFDPTIFKIMDAESSTARRDLPGGTGPSSVNQQLDRARSWLEDHSETY